MADATSLKALSNKAAGLVEHRFTALVTWLASLGLPSGWLGPVVGFPRLVGPVPHPLLTAFLMAEQNVVR